MKKVIVEKEFYAVLDKRGDILGRSDLRVFAAATAEEALEIQKAEKADAVVVSLDIPGMGGDRLCSLLRAKEETKKIHIVLACGGSKSDFKRSEACGASACIITPVNPDALYSIICQALNIPERKGIRVLIKVQVEGRFKSEPFYCSSKDVSISGIFIETEKTLAKGDVLTCSFYLPDTDRIDARGEVVRVSKTDIEQYQYGVKFEAIEPESEAAIQAFINRAKRAMTP